MKEKVRMMKKKDANAPETKKAVEEMMALQKMVKELRESTIPRKDSMRTRYNRKMLEMKDDEEHRTPIQLIREIMKEARWIF